MNDILRPGSNAVLMRELRASLRNARPFALIAIYVAILGSIVVSQFPDNTQITIESGGGRLGKDLYWMFVGAQAALILLVLPAIASGALSQEREQRTLEPLLLSPLTPLQIVWGKAVGVLSLGGLLLISTLPLTSLCFLLGGVSPGELVAAYIVLLGLTLFTASLGIYCSSKWTHTVRATLVCYVILPFCLLFVVLFAGIGIVVAALGIFGLILSLVIRGWKHWGNKTQKDQKSLSQRLGVLWSWLGWGVVAAVAILLLLVIARDQENTGNVVMGGFAVAYLIFLSQMALQQAALEIVRLPEPTGSARQRLQDFKAEWQQAMTTPAPYLPDPMLLDSQREAQRQEYERAREVAEAEEKLTTALPVAPVKTQEKETYGKAPFLSDKLNPIFAKDMRSGLLGKFEYLMRFSYVAVIGSELLLIFLALVLPAQSVGDEWLWFRTWANSHLIILLVAGAWLGARSIAPEHEQQTLAQLIMTPLLPRQILAGKVQAVMTYTFYLFMLGAPMALMLAGVKVVTWPAALSFLLIEIVFSALAACYGMLCSLRAGSTRRALAFALGGVFVLVTAGMIFDSFIQNAFRLLIGEALLTPLQAQMLNALLSPLHLLEMILKPSAFISALSVNGTSAAVASAFPILPVFFSSLGMWSLVAAVMLWMTARGFQRYADTI